MLNPPARIPSISDKNDDSIFYDRPSVSLIVVATTIIVDKSKGKLHTIGKQHGVVIGGLQTTITHAVISFSVRLMPSVI